MILDDIRNYFRRRALRKYSSKVPTSILPLGEIRTATVVIDAQDRQFDACRQVIQAFFRENGIKGEIYFMDLRKIGKEERLITSASTTFLRRDLNWFGWPGAEKINLLRGSSTDLFICLLPDTEYLTQFIAKCSTARYKVGRIQQSGDTFDLVVSDPPGRPLTQTESFEAMKPYLKLIQKG